MKRLNSLKQNTFINDLSNSSNSENSSSYSTIKSKNFEPRIFISNSSMIPIKKLENKNFKFIIEFEKAKNFSNYFPCNNISNVKFFKSMNKKSVLNRKKMYMDSHKNLILARRKKHKNTDENIDYFLKKKEKIRLFFIFQRIVSEIINGIKGFRAFFKKNQLNINNLQKINTI